MTIPLDRLVKKLDEGEIKRTASGRTLFKLSSYEGNPIVKPQELGLTWYERGKLQVGAVFNGGATIFQGKVILTPRCHWNYCKSKFFDPKLGKEKPCLENYVSEIWSLVSHDGIKFQRFRDVVIRGDGTDHRDFTYGIEDIRIVPHDRKYLLVGCGKVGPPFKASGGDRIAIYSTENFMDITYHGMVSIFDSRNAIPFFIDDETWLFLRFHPNIHLTLLEGGLNQLLNPFKHEERWIAIHQRKEENLLLRAGEYPHEKEKIGPSTPLVKTPNGWLFLYHGVGEMSADVCREYGLERGIDRGYSVCAALLDLDDPRQVLCRTKDPIFIPSKPYELGGDEEYPVDTPAVVFPVGAIARNKKLLIYCGAGDKHVTLISCDLGKLVDYLLENCRLS